MNKPADWQAMDRPGVPDRRRKSRLLLGFGLLSGLLLLSGCQQLESLLAIPPITPQQWLYIQPHTTLTLAGRETILMQPSSTVFVYLLGLVAMGVGLRFWRIRQGQRTRLWWGLALILWGLGALAAGTSY